MVVLKGAFFTSAYLGRVMQIRIHVISKAFFPLLADHQPGDGVTIIRLSSCLTQLTRYFPKCSTCMYVKSVGWWHPGLCMMLVFVSHC
jgi:hypothetical protein